MDGLHPRLFLIPLFLLALWPAGVHGQTIQLKLEDASLREALIDLRVQAGIDIVFADGLVDDARTTCRYEGRRPAEALECLLDDTELHAERVRRHQYVVVRSERQRSGQAGARVTLSGFVVDAESGEVLPGAHVYLPDLRTGTVTNDAGYFALPSIPPGTYRSQISYLGYAAQDTQLIPGGTPMTIALEPVALESGAILVEEERLNAADAKSVPGLVAEPVGRLEAMPSFPGESDLLQSLQWFPGIRKSGEVNGGLIIRGASPDQNLYLLDGAPVYHPWHAFSLISTFQTETFKDIRLYRGSLPSEYGGRLSSVLDAQMKDGSRHEPHALIALSAISGRFVVETPATRNSSFMVAGRRSYLDKLIGREHPVENDGRRDTLRTGYYFYDASAKYTMRLSRRDRLSVSYYHGGDDLDLRLPFDLSLDFASWLRPTDLFFEVAHRWENRLLSARYQHLHSEKIFVTTTAYYSSYDAAERAFLRPTSSAAMRSDYRVDLRDTGVKVDLEYFHSLSHQFQMGIHSVVRDFDSSLDATIRRSPGAVDERSESSRATRPEIAVYTQDVWKPSERWTVRPGLRFSVFGAGLYTAVSPGLSFQYAVDPQYLRLNAGASRHVQFLHRLRDRYAFTYDLVSSRWIPAGQDVKPSAGYQVSGGFDSRLLPGLSLSGDVYWRAAEDVLLPEDVFRSKDELVGPGIHVGELLGQYVVGEARAYGVELTTAVIDGPWRLWVSYAGGKSLTRSVDLGETAFRSARYDVPRSLRAVAAREWAGWRLTTSLDLRSGYPNTVPIAQYEIGDPLDSNERYLHRPYVNNGRLPPYFRVDVSAQRRFDLLGADWRAVLHVYNVTNRRNVIARQYVPADGGMEIQNRRGLPILPLFEFEMQL